MKIKKMVEVDKTRRFCLLKPECHYMGTATKDEPVCMRYRDKYGWYIVLEDYWQRYNLRFLRCPQCLKEFGK